MISTQDEIDMIHETLSRIHQHNPDDKVTPLLNRITNIIADYL